MNEKEKGEHSLKIEKLVAGGDGLARREGMVWFIPGVLPGETVTAAVQKREKSHIKGRLISIDEPSPDRRDPFCPHFGRCGGCSWQFTDTETQMRLKEEIWRDSLHSVAPSVEPIFQDREPDVRYVSPEKGCRTRLQIHSNGQQRGFMAAGSRDIVPITHCPVAADPLNQLLADEKRNWPEGRWNAFCDQETAVAEPEDKRVTLQVSGHSVTADARGFFQSHLEGTEAIIRFLLHDKRTEHAIDGRYPKSREQRNMPVYDKSRQAVESDGVNDKTREHHRLVELYCGTGLFGLALATHFKEILGAESSRITAPLARLNWQNLPHARVLSAPVEKELGRRLKVQKGDTWLVDPPRNGLSKPVRRFFTESFPQTLVYISCNPVTQARDLEALHQAGARFRVDAFGLFDLYPHTPHLETVLILSREDA